MTGRLEEGSEVGPIVFRSEGAASPDDGVDHIRLPEEPRSFAPMAPEPIEVEEPVLVRSPPRRRRNGVTRGLALGVVAGAAIGGAATLYVRGLDRPPAPPPRRPAGQVLVQAMNANRGPASIPAAPAPEPPPRARALTAPEPARPGKPPAAAFDLDNLARAIAAASPPTPAANAPPVAPPPAQPPPVGPPAVEPPRPVPTVVARAAPPVVAAPKIDAPKVDAPKIDAPRPAPRLDADIALAQRQLSLAYDRAMASAPDRAALHADQQRWEAQRDRLGGDRDAILRLYQARTAALLEQDRVERKKGGIARLLRE